MTKKRNNNHVEPSPDAPKVQSVELDANLFNSINLYLTERPWREVNQLIGALEQARQKAELRLLAAPGEGKPPPKGKGADGTIPPKGKRDAVSSKSADSS